MSHKGNMRLLNKNGDVITYRKYFDRTERKKIIIKWRLLYGRRFKTLILAVIPNIESDRVRVDGTNFGSDMILR